MKNKIIFKTLMLKGEAGSTIVSMEKTGHVGTADIYTITFNDGSTTEISLENMSAITSVEKTSSTDTEDIYTITCADGSTQTFSVLNHNADIAAMSDNIDSIDARVDNFINSVVPNTVETLWTGSIKDVGDSATLSKAVSNFDYIDLYLLGSADSKYIRVPATQTAVEIQQQNLSDDASSNFLRLWEMGVSISGSTVSITKSIAWAWDDPNNSNPTVTANAQNSIPITRIDGVKVASDTPAEVTDIRVGADGTTYNSAGAAVRGQISDLKNILDAIGNGKYIIGIGDPIVFENTIYDTTHRVVKPLTGAVVWCYPLIGGKSYIINVTNRSNVLFGVSNTLYNGVEMTVSYSVNADVTEYEFDNVQNYAYLYITKKGQSSEYGIDVSYPFWNISLTQSQMSAINESTEHLSIKANGNITPYIDGYVVAATGNIVTVSNFRATEFIDIAPAKNIIVMMPRLNSSVAGAGLAFYDANKNYINDGGIVCNVSTETTAEERIIEVPQNARYIRTTVRSNEWDGFYAKQDDIYINTLNIKKIKDKASTFGIQMFAKIGVIGDSISVGWAKDKNGNNSRRNLDISWPQQLARRCGFTAYNLGASGVDPIEWFQSNYEFAQYCYTQYQTVGFCDLYIVGLGLNPTSSIGSTADINQSDYTQNAETFYGQYARIIQMINAEHPNAIVMCLTEPTTAISGYDTAVRNICALNSINAELVDLEKDYFDLFNTEEIISERQPDGLHYTPYGYSLLADAMEKALNDYIAKHTTSFKYVGVASV